MNQIYHHKASTVQKENNGIVCFRATADDIYDADDLVTLLDQMEQAAEGKPFLLLMQSNGYEFLMTKEARNLFNKYEKAIRLIKAEAIVTRSTSTRILYNLLTKIHSPKFPFKAFGKESDAVNWLLTHQ